MDGWRGWCRHARDLAQLRLVLTAWARAAGGQVTGNILHLPRDLPHRLALAELKTQARCARLKVEAPVCSWCPNETLAGDSLCEHCRWLAGARP